MKTAASEKARRRIIDYRMIWRWHFYAGLLCIPFIIVLALTGSIYLFKPQIEAAIDRPYNGLTAAPRPLSLQVEAALRAFPGASLQSVEIRQNPADAARVVLSDKGQRTRVYVHPQTLSILKSVREDDRFINVVKTIHGELVMGQFGTLLVETAACWALVMIVTGLYLWWPREAKGLAGVFWPRMGLGPKQFWRDLHGVVGIYVSVFAIFLLLTGLPWTTVWGAGFKAARQVFAEQTINPDWSSGRAAEKRADPYAHHGHGAPTPSGAIDVSQLDAIAAELRAADLPPPVMLVAPTLKQPNWQGVSQTQNRPQALTVTFDHMGMIEGQKVFADRPLIDRVVAIGIAAHEGQLFGGLNQFLGVLTAAGLVLLCVSAVIMWWQRRPDKAHLGAPSRLPD